MVEELVDGWDIEEEMGDWLGANDSFEDKKNRVTIILWPLWAVR